MYATHYVSGDSRPYYVSYFGMDGDKGPDYGRFKTFDEAEELRYNLSIEDDCMKDCCSPTYSLGNLECKHIPTAPCAPSPVRCGSKKKESTMRDYPNVSIDNVISSDRKSDLSTARDALVDRLRDVREEKRSALRVTFNMDKPEGPKTATEAIARIIAGKFQPIDKAKDEAQAEANYSYTWYRSIDWRTAPKDEAGYDAASEKLTAAYADAKLTIQVLPEVDGLAAFKSFKDFSAVTLN